jgi:hypothetical protein
MTFPHDLETDKEKCDRMGLGVRDSGNVVPLRSGPEPVHIDSADNESVKSLNLQCGKDAEKLTIIDTDSSVSSVVSDITVQPPGQPIEASASGF